MSQKTLNIIFIYIYANVNIFAGNSVGNQLHQTNNKIFETRYLSGFEQVDLGKNFKEYDVFKIKSDSIISYLQNEKFEKNLTIDFFHLGKWHLNLYANTLLNGEAYMSYQGLTCESLGEIHFNISSGFIEAYIDDGKNRYFIEPLKQFTKNIKHKDLYVVYCIKNILKEDKKNNLETFLNTARSLKKNDGSGNKCDTFLTYEKNMFCWNNNSIFPILQNAKEDGTFSAFPTGLHLNTKTGEIEIGKSKVDMYIISYKSGNCVSDFVLDILDLPSAAFELPKQYFHHKDRPIKLISHAKESFFSGIGVKDGIFYPDLVPKNLRYQPLEITQRVSNGYCENSSIQTVFVGNNLFVRRANKNRKAYILQTSIVLEDAYVAETKQMRTDLLKQEVLPLSQPYNIAPWNYQGEEKLLTYAHFPQNTVDWVLLELRDAQKVNAVLARKAAFLLADGSIVNFKKHKDGVVFENINDKKKCYVVVRHRNHIDIISNNTISMANATHHQRQHFLKIIYAKDYRKHITLKPSALFSGDADGNNVVSVNDFEYFQKEYGKKNTYSFFDFNLDGKVDEIDFECYIKNATEIGMKEVRY